MTDDRRAFRVYLLLAGLGGALAALALLVALTRVRVTSSSGALEACTSLVSRPDLIGAMVLGTFVLAAVGSGRAAWRLFQMVRRTRQLQAARPVVDEVDGALVVSGRHVEAYCAGLVRPHVYVTSAAVRALGERELAAVIAHERHHARRRDPLRLVLVRAIGDALFFLPGLRRLGERYGELAEIAADDAALRATGDRAALASALLTFDDECGAGGAAMPERVDHLCGVRPRWDASVALLARAGATLVAGLAVFITLAAQTGPASVALAQVALHATVVLAAAGALVIGTGWLARRRRTRRILG